jgi:hypothetical protein
MRSRSLDGHYEARHLRIRHVHRLATAHLVDHRRDYRSARVQHVAEAEGRKAGLAMSPDVVTGGDKPLPEQLRRPHHVNRLAGLVGADEDHPLRLGVEGGLDHVLGSQDVCLHGFKRVKFAGRDMLHRGGMEDDIDPFHGAGHSAGITDVADQETERLLPGVPLLEQVLLVLVTGQDADRLRPLGEGLGYNLRSDGTRAADDQNGLLFEKRSHRLALFPAHFPTSWRRPL